MATTILVRHGRTAANSDGILAGRTPGVHLDDHGRDQAATAAARLAGLPVVALVTSPLERTVETAKAIGKGLAGAGTQVTLRRDRGLIECGYGEWTGQSLRQLAKEPLWRTVQAQPSAVQFPDGESLAGMQARAVACVRRWDAEVESAYGQDAIWIGVSHGDVIKSIVADAVGAHLDQFQRIMVAPASVTVIRYTPHRPFVMHLNDSGSDLSGLQPPPRRRRRAGRPPPGGAAVGGGGGAAHAHGDPRRLPVAAAEMGPLSRNGWRLPGRPVTSTPPV